LARAQAAYPSQTIRLIHGYDAGSNPDTIARYLAPGMSEILGVQIVIEGKSVLAHGGIEGAFSGVAEGWMADIVDQS